MKGDTRSLDNDLHEGGMKPTFRGLKSSIKVQGRLVQHSHTFKSCSGSDSGSSDYSASIV